MKVKKNETFMLANKSTNELIFWRPCAFHLFKFYTFPYIYIRENMLLSTILFFIKPGVKYFL